MSNKALVEAKVNGAPRAELWANDKSYIRGIAGTHPRSNRSNCLRVTAASAETPVVVYEDYKFPVSSISGAYTEYAYQYLYYAQYGIIHGSGGVALISGTALSQGSSSSGTSAASVCAMQSPSGCEQLSLKWAEKCLGELQRLRLDPADLFRLHDPVVRQRWMNDLFVLPFTKFKAQRRGPSPSLRLEQFVMLRAAPKLCTFNMSHLLHTLIAAGAYTNGTVQPSEGKHLTTASAAASFDSPSAGASLSTSVSVPSSLIVHDSVLVMTAFWDHNYHHFIIDSLVKIIRYLPFLTKYPAVKLHIMRFEQFCKKLKYIRGGVEIRRRFWDLLGIVLRGNGLSPQGLVSDAAIAERIVSGK